MAEGLAAMQFIGNAISAKGTLMGGAGSAYRTYSGVRNM